jgi:hypothetical protein
LRLRGRCRPRRTRTSRPRVIPGAQSVHCIARLCATARPSSRLPAQHGHAGIPGPPGPGTGELRAAGPARQLRAASSARRSTTAGGQLGQALDNCGRPARRRRATPEPARGTGPVRASRPGTATPASWPARTGSGDLRAAGPARRRARQLRAAGRVERGERSRGSRPARAQLAPPGPARPRRHPGPPEPTRAS